ncbi:MAG: DUF3426 domain-containing protein [Burkholderiales bacterium]|nr:DUF3426 domain-containing protein [Burkholderiales bacterium]
MTLATRCPECGTAFRVRPAQLAACGGKVRCGRCRAVFDGVAGLLDEPASAQPQPPEATGQLALFEPPEPGPARPQPHVAQPQATSEPPQTLASAPASAEPAAAFLAPRAPTAPRRLAWGIAAAVALLALALQATIHYRTEIAVLAPKARSALSALCERLGCELRLPERPELMAIESSDLRADAQRDGAIVLDAVLRNRAPFVQAYPALELTLTDERDQPVVRRVLLPADYLGADAGARLAQGIAPGGEAALRVAFDASRVRAVGYRLYLFYP